jgi:DNA-binding transcriptional LysR family regulator
MFRPAPEHDALRGAERLIGRGLKLTHLRLVAALAETGQLTAAGRVLNLTQPAASRLLSEAEAIAGHRLCERQSKGIAMTAAGAALARRARAVLTEIAEAGREIGDVATGRLGSVRIGAVTAPAIELVVPVLQRLLRRYPGLEAELHVATSDLLLADLVRGRHDFVLGRLPAGADPRPFELRSLAPERLALIVRAGHPLACATSVSAGDLAPYEWVMQPPGSPLRATLEEALLARGAPPPHCRLSTASLLVTLALVSRSDAIAPASVEVARLVAGQEGADVAILPIDFAVEVKPYSLIRMRGRALSRPAALVHDELVEARPG